MPEPTPEEAPASRAVNGLTGYFQQYGNMTAVGIVSVGLLMFIVFNNGNWREMMAMQRAEQAHRLEEIISRREADRAFTEQLAKNREAVERLTLEFKHNLEMVEKHDASMRGITHERISKNHEAILALQKSMDDAGKRQEKTLEILAAVVRKLQADTGKQ